MTYLKDPNDYLVKSGVFDQKVLNEDTIDSYKEILSDSTISKFHRSLIQDFLIPYNISLLKYILNREYYETPFAVDFKHGHKQIAPSLKLIKENKTTYWAAGYPDWFYYTFPDVAIWAIKGEGNAIIKSKFSRIKESKFVDLSRKQIWEKHLKRIIDMYVKRERRLECSI